MADAKSYHPFSPHRAANQYPEYEGATGDIDLVSDLLRAFLQLYRHGHVGAKIGRRRFFMIAGPLIATMGSALLYVLSHGDGLSFSTVMLLVCLLAVVVTSPWGVIITYINEHFATGVRATGFGVGFSLSVIIPSLCFLYGLAQCRGAL